VSCGVVVELLNANTEIHPDLGNPDAEIINAQEGIEVKSISGDESGGDKVRPSTFTRPPGELFNRPPGPQLPISTKKRFRENSVQGHNGEIR